MLNSDYGSILHRFLHIWFEKYCNLEIRANVNVNVIKTGAIRQPAYSYLYVPYSNFGAILYRVWDLAWYNC